jgi:hypothetical protein
MLRREGALDVSDRTDIDGRRLCERAAGKQCSDEECHGLRSHFAFFFIRFKGTMQNLARWRPGVPVPDDD